MVHSDSTTTNLGGNAQLAPAREARKEDKTMATIGDETHRDVIDPEEYEFYEVEPGLWRNKAGDEYDYRDMDPCQCEGPNETYPHGVTCALHSGTSR